MCREKTLERKPAPESVESIAAKILFSRDRKGRSLRVQFYHSPLGFACAGAHTLFSYVVVSAYAINWHYDTFLYILLVVTIPY